MNYQLRMNSSHAPNTTDLIPLLASDPVAQSLVWKKLEDSLIGVARWTLGKGRRAVADYRGINSEEIAGLGYANFVTDLRNGALRLQPGQSLPHDRGSLEFLLRSYVMRAVGNLPGTPPQVARATPLNGSEPTAPVVEDPLEIEEARLAIAKAIEKLRGELPAETLRVVTLAMDGQSEKQIAEQLGKSIRFVQSRIESFKRMLQKRSEED
jgi:hypothetical protein